MDDKEKTDQDKNKQEKKVISKDEQDAINKKNKAARDFAKKHPSTKRALRCSCEGDERKEKNKHKRMRRRRRRGR